MKKKVVCRSYCCKVSDFVMCDSVRADLNCLRTTDEFNRLILTKCKFYILTDIHAIHLYRVLIEENPIGCESEQLNSFARH